MKKIYFSCFTLYHLYVAAYYSAHFDRSKVETILVYFDQGQKLDIHVFSSEFDDIIVIDVNRPPNRLLRVLRAIVKHGYLSYYYYKKRLNTHHDDVLVVFSDQHLPSYRLTQLFRNATVVLIEEGLGIYESYRFMHHSVSEVIFNIITGSRTIPGIGYSSNINTIIASEPAKIPSEKRMNRLLVHQGCIFAETGWINKLKIADDVLNKPGLYKIHPIILWIGQPLSEVNIDYQGERRLTKGVLDCFEGYPIIIKPHPREEENKYNNLLNDKCTYSLFNVREVSAEILSMYIKPDIIITPFSSAAVNIFKSGYCKKLILCYKLFGIRLDDWLFDDLKGNNDVYDISSISELKAISSGVIESCSLPCIHEDKTTFSNNSDLEYFRAVISE